MPCCDQIPSAAFIFSAKKGHNSKKESIGVLQTNMSAASLSQCWHAGQVDTCVALNTPSAATATPEPVHKGLNMGVPTSRSLPPQANLLHSLSSSLTHTIKELWKRLLRTKPYIHIGFTFNLHKDLFNTLAKRKVCFGLFFWGKTSECVCVCVCPCVSACLPGL